MQKIFVIAAALGLALPAVSAQAEQSDQRSVKVAYSDLNLATPSGQERLTRRIESAARRVCGYHSPVNRSIMENSKARACYKQAKAGALIRFAAVVEQHRKGG